MQGEILGGKDAAQRCVQVCDCRGKHMRHPGTPVPRGGLSDSRGQAEEAMQAHSRRLECAIQREQLSVQRQEGAGHVFRTTEFQKCLECRNGENRLCAVWVPSE